MCTSSPTVCPQSWSPNSLSADPLTGSASGRGRACGAGGQPVAGEGRPREDQRGARSQALPHRPCTRHRDGHARRGEGVAGAEKDNSVAPNHRPSLITHSFSQHPLHEQRTGVYSYCQPHHSSPSRWLRAESLSPFAETATAVLWYCGRRRHGRSR